MKTMTIVQASKTEWVQPSATEPAFELRADGAAGARLAFRSAEGTLASAEGPGGKWTYKRVGFLNPRVTIRREGEAAALAEYRPRVWGDGVLELADGTMYEWKPMNFWGTAWAFIGEGDRPLVAFDPSVEMDKENETLKTHCGVELSPEAVDEPRLGLLLTFGFYLLVLRRADIGTTTARVPEIS
jgi:hypothetical protein